MLHHDTKMFPPLWCPSPNRWAKAGRQVAEAGLFEGVGERQTQSTFRVGRGLGKVMVLVVVGGGQRGPSLECVPLWGGVCHQVSPLGLTMPTCTD